MERSIKILIAQHNFPEEIVEEILSRLPVESLLKFRCVSKSWRSLIDSERFIKTHLKNSTENELLSHHRIIFNPVLSLNRILKMCSWASLLNQPIDKPIEFDDGKYIVNIVGCCNGLVCLVQDTGRFILWNPATRMMHFPDADSNLVGEDKFFMYGFGYVESSDDYKVFVIMTPNESPPIGKVYSLKNHLWKTLEEEDFPCGGDKVGVFVSGNLHWFEDYEDLTDDEDPAIFAFDLKNETFVIVEQPYYSDTIVPTQTLGVIEGCLSVLCDYEDYSQVWVMKEYGVKDSWVNLFTISNFDHPPLMLQRVRSFWTGPNGEVLLTYYSTLMIYHCNIEDNMFHCSVIIDIDKVMGEGVYVESLVSLGPDAVQERQPQSRTLEDQNDIFE